MLQKQQHHDASDHACDRTYLKACSVVVIMRAVKDAHFSAKRNFPSGQGLFSNQQEGLPNLLLDALCGKKHFISILT